MNREEWRGKEPRSCAVTKCGGRSHAPGAAFIIEIEVSYRPKGYISYVGQTKYDGWDAVILDRAPDGTLLDGKGQPLAEGQDPVYLTFAPHGDTDFNEFDFGEFLGEEDIEDVRTTTFDDILAEVHQSGHLSMAIKSSFMAPRRSRPLKKIVLSNSPTGDTVDRFGTSLRFIDINTPHLEQVLMEEVSQLIFDYLEGKVGIKCFGNENLSFVELSDSLVDCEPNEMGEDSWFSMLYAYTPIGFLKDLAMKVASIYEVDVEIIEGKNGGIVLRRISK